MQCAGITKAKELCKNEATKGSYCWHHAPDTADERRRRASRGGKAGGNGRPAGGFGRGEVGELKSQLADLYNETLVGNVDRGVAAVLAQIVNARTRLLDFEQRRDTPGLITPEELRETMGMVVEILTRHIPETERLRAINEDLEAILSGAAST